MEYLHQKASPWVSFTVLAGGLLTAGILFILVQIEQNAHGALAPSSYEDALYAELVDL